MRSTEKSKKGAMVMTTQVTEHKVALEQELVVAKRLAETRQEAYQQHLTPQGEAPPGFRAHSRGRKNSLRLWILAREAVGPIEAKLEAAKAAEAESEREAMAKNIETERLASEVETLEVELKGNPIPIIMEKARELESKRAQLEAYRDY